MKKQFIALAGAITLSTVAFAGSASAKEVTLVSGDTLSELAVTHNTTVNSLMQLNNLSSDLIFAGAQLEVGDGNGSTQTAPVQAQAKTAYKAPVQKAQTYKAPVKQVQSQSTYKAPVQQKQAVQKTTSYTGSSSSAKSWIAMKESTNNYNARSATGKYVGKYQLDRSYLNGDYSPANQEKVADNYVKNRYGSWENAKAAWQQKGWY
ncbi:aggregation-promoting factor [Kurthia sibirica]|uniref:LysM domain-containing protein n=1 Tax=Kurthia sibirica TaxID=202750 RepID=A0A2U3AP54_9BACL|nr:LysM peptidoglycan-binding domain-containing protein [Kurthia sibirica]PWI26317.1 hypothetical protein DEX24_02990 [Kurthia sibirica]GEK35014.1 peptidase M23 [Kurthia sibirica]